MSQTERSPHDRACADSGDGYGRNRTGEVEGLMWMYDGEPIRMDPETYYFLRVVDGGTSEGYREWLRAAIECKRLTMAADGERRE